MFLGGQIPAIGTYEITVYASIKSEYQYICSSFEFELEVVDENSTGTAEEASSAETIAECNKSQAVLEDLLTTYEYECTSGVLLLKTIPFTDSLGGQCLSEWQFYFESDDESDTVAKFDSTSKILTFYTSRADLSEVSATLKVIRDDGSLIQETQFTFHITVPTDESGDSLTDSESAAEDDDES